MKKNLILLCITLICGIDVTAQVPTVIVPVSHQKGFEQAMYTADGKHILTTSYYEPAKLWNANDGKLILNITDVQDPITYAAISADGKTVITLSDYKTATTWPMDNLEKPDVFFDESNTYNRFQINVSGLFITPDAKKAFIFLHSNYHSCELWDCGAHKKLYDVQIPGEPIKDVSFSHDAKTAIMVFENGDCILLDVIGNHEQKVNTNSKIVAASFSGDDRQIIMMAQNGNLEIADGSTGVSNVLRRLPFKEIKNGAFSPDKITAVVFDEKNITLVDIHTGKAKPPLRSYDEFHEGNIYGVFSPNGKDLIIASHQFGVPAQIWDVAAAKPRVFLTGATAGVGMATLSNDGNRLLLASYDNSAKIWDLERLNVAANLIGHKAMVTFAAFDKTNDKVITSSNDRKTMLWDSKSGKSILEIKTDNFPESYADFSYDGSQVILGYSIATNTLFDPERHFELFSMATGDSLRNLSKTVYAQQIPKFERNNEIGAGEVFGPAPGIIYAHAKGQLADFLQKYNDFIAFGRVNDEQSKGAMMDRAHVLWYFDLNTGQQISRVPMRVTAEWAAIDYKRDIAFLNINSEIVLINLRTGKRIGSLYNFTGTDFMTRLPNGYYKCTPIAAKQLYYTKKDLQMVTFDQLDIKYNRPDLVLKAFNCPDTALIHAYHRAYEKRIEKLKIDTSAFTNDYSVPKAEIIDRKQDQGQITLKISACDSLTHLDRFNVLVNQVPVYGINGISLRNRRSKCFDTVVTIKLSEGENRIEVSAINLNGLENYHIPINVTFDPPTHQEPKLYFVGIGVDKYADRSRDLQWSVADVRSLYAKLKSKYGANFVTVDTIFNENVTINRVAAIKNKLAQCGINDKVVVVYSGHGLFSNSYDYYLTGYHTNFSEPEREGIPYGLLESTLDNIPARKKLLLLDACNSGEIDQKAAMNNNKTTQTLTEQVAAAKVRVIEKKGNGGISGQGMYELMQDLFVNVTRNTGTTIIAAAAGNQFAFGEKNLRHGAFTFAALEFLNTKQSSIDGLKKYVNQRVPELTKGKQVPTTRSETDAIDWNL